MKCYYFDLSLPYIDPKPMWSEVVSTFKQMWLAWHDKANADNLNVG